MERANKVPIYLVTGYLGSGKTTLLKQLIQTYQGKHKIAVVQNEFAPGNIDGGELKRVFDDLEILEINNGSVFCVCRLSDFITSATDFIKAHEPDLLVIEASGLTDPIAIQEIMKQEPLASVAELSKIWTVVDAVQFPKISAINQRVKHQVKVADEVIINKCDLVGVDIQAVKESILSLNEKASIHQATYCDIPLDLLPSSIEHEGKRLALNEIDRPEINVAVFKTRRQLQHFDTKRFFEGIKGAERVKGYIRLDESRSIHLQGSFEQQQTEIVTDYTGDTELVSLGGKITPRNLKEAINKAQEIS